MKAASFLPIIFWCLLILGGNYYLFSTTNEKITLYDNQPPFRIEDGTRSGDLALVLDGDLSSFWEKKRNSLAAWDFILEMKLTHIWNGKQFSARRFKNVEWVSCPGRNLPNFHARLILRESINVDKESRFPADLEISSIDFRANGQKSYSFPLNNIIQIKNETNYPHGIFIVTLEMLLPKKNTIDNCFAEIRLNE